MVNIRSPLFVFAGLVLWTLVGDTAAAVSIPDPDAVDAVLDRYVVEGYYPFIYARLENRDGNVLYEHSAVNRELLPDAEINGQTWIRIWSMSKIVTISTVLDLVEDGLWIGGGYEGTHFWVDPKREFVGVIMSQMRWIPEGGGGRDGAFRGELYREFWAEEAN